MGGLVRSRAKAVLSPGLRIRFCLKKDYLDYQAVEFGGKAVLINPAVRPYE